MGRGRIVRRDARDDDVALIGEIAEEGFSLAPTHAGVRAFDRREALANFTGQCLTTRRLQ